MFIWIQWGFPPDKRTVATARWSLIIVQGEKAKRLIYNGLFLFSEILEITMKVKTQYQVLVQIVVLDNEHKIEVLNN